MMLVFMMLMFIDDVHVVVHDGIGVDVPLLLLYMRIVNCMVQCVIVYCVVITCGSYIEIRCYRIYIMKYYVCAFHSSTKG